MTAQGDSRGRKAWAAQRLRHPVVRGVLSLTGVQVVQLALPLATLPYLTRVLGPEGWGAVAAALALGNLAATLPEYGFSVSASRTLSTLPPHDARRAALAAGVVAAKGLLAVGAVVLVLATQLSSRAALASGGLVAGACLIAAGHGLWMAWYFEGAERAGAFLRVVVGSRLLYVALLFALVHDPLHAARVPILYGLSAFVTAGLALRLMPRTRTATLAEAGRVLRQGWMGFVQRVLVMTYAAGNVFWLSLLAPPAEVGGYGVAEQTARAACLLLLPLNRALYPRYSRVAAGAAAESWMRHTQRGMAALGVGLSLALFAAAPALPWVFGAGYAAFVPVLRWLAPLPLLVALSQFWTVQGLMARGHDRAAALLFGLGAAVDLGLAVWLVPTRGALGMAMALVGAEVAVTLASALLAHRLISPARS